RAATRLRRSRLPGLPGPNRPIAFDRPPFLLRVIGPDGRPAQCYDLDQRPARPARLYVFYDQANNYILNQLPVVGVAPGDAGYTDLWDIWKVTAPASFVPDNSLRDFEAVERLLSDPASGFTAARTGALVNGPIVPDGSTAEMKAERRGGAATLRYLWYKGQLAPYLYFEQRLRLEGSDAPTGRMTLEPSSDRAGGTGGASAAPGDLTGEKLRIDTLPGDAGYSPLRLLVDGAGRTLFEDPINCPVVGS
ncbi:MAG TPA: hypothetical protein VNL37_05030, partial [Candidatus Polarisedimenticolia bacterium]|nr:hypothetical protein [Candidatus Polarisedimenticolia bacterium]